MLSELHKVKEIRQIYDQRHISRCNREIRGDEMASLSLKHICQVRPGCAKAVNNFRMQIPDKEWTVFAGPSGCGTSPPRERSQG